MTAKQTPYIILPWKVDFRLSIENEYERILECKKKERKERKKWTYHPYSCQPLDTWITDKLGTGSYGFCQQDMCLGGICRCIAYFF